MTHKTNIMKRIFLSLLIAAIIFPATSEAKKLKQKAEYVIFIAIDGWATSSFKDNVDNMPTVKGLMENGCYSFHKRSTMPSASAINWATIFMGVPTEMHGYYKWNSSKPDIEAYELGPNGLPVTLYTLLSDQRPDRKSACIYNWDGIGPVVDTLSMDYHLYDPGYHAGEGYSLEKYTRERAVKCIKEMHPNFFTFYIGDVDETGHKYGWASVEYQKCLKETDDAVAMIIQALKDEGIYDKSIIIMGSDHGGKGKGHGGFTLEEMETPFVICGKNVARKGELDGFMMQYDLSATIAEALGLKVPGQWRGKPMPVFK